MNTVNITYEYLKSKDFCKRQLELFKETFPEGISVNSKENLVTIAKMFGKDFNISWAARYLLVGEYKDKFLKVAQQARNNYVEAIRPAKNKFIEAEGLRAWYDYKNRPQKTYNKFLKDTQPYWNNCEEAIAAAFAKSYYQQESTKVNQS